MTQQILFETTDVMRFTSQGVRNYNIIDTSSFELNHDSDINREVFAYLLTEKFLPTHVF